VPSGILTIHMPKRHFAKQTNICDFGSFKYYKQSDKSEFFIEPPKAIICLSVSGGLRAPWFPRPGAQPLDPATALHLFDAHNNWIMSKFERHKTYCSPVPWSFPPVAPSFKFLAPPMQSSHSTQKRGRWKTFFSLTFTRGQHQIAQPVERREVGRE